MWRILVFPVSPIVLSRSMSPVQRRLKHLEHLEAWRESQEQTRMLRSWQFHQLSLQNVSKACCGWRCTYMTLYQPTILGFWGMKSHRPRNHVFLLHQSMPKHNQRNPLSMSPAPLNLYLFSDNETGTCSWKLVHRNQKCTFWATNLSQVYLIRQAPVLCICKPRK